MRKIGYGSLRGNGGRTNGTLLSVGVGWWDGWWDGWRVTTSYPDLVVRFQIGRPAPVNAIHISSGPLCDGVWQHIATTWDGKRMRLYFNGEVVAEAEYTGDYTNPRSDAQFRVGYAAYGVGSLVLEVDEVAIYNRALSVEELHEHATRFAPAPIPASQAVLAAFREGNGKGPVEHGT